jgi:nicotinamidase-related amidase
MMSTEARVLEARPYPFPVGPLEGLALVVIDMQRDFLEPGGFGATLGNDVTRLQRIVPVVARLLDIARAAELLVIHTREGHLPDLSDCPTAKLTRGSPGLRIGDHGPLGRILIRGEPGHAIVPELAPWGGEIVIDKPGKGAFYGTELGRVLRDRGIRQLLVAGVTTEVCVQTTLREANDRGYECALIEDATESYFEEFKQSTLDMVRAQGAIIGWTAKTDDLEHALRKDA